MHCHIAFAALSCALALLGTGLQTAGLPGPAPEPGQDSVYVTAAHGEALVTVQVIAPRHLLDATGQGTWSGDTLTTRTPLALSLRRSSAQITFRALAGEHGVRVTIPAREGRALVTRTGEEVRLSSGAAGWSLNAST
jgi:hypothetical protein